MDEIKQYNFDRRGVIKKLRKNFLLFLRSCRLFECSNYETAKNNFDAIIEKLNFDFLNKEIFENQKIYLYLRELDSFIEFLKEYESTVRTITSDDMLQNSSIRFVEMQKAFIEKINRKFEVYQCLIKRHI